MKTWIVVIVLGLGFSAHAEFGMDDVVSHPSYGECMVFTPPSPSASDILLSTSKNSMSGMSITRVKKKDCTLVRKAGARKRPALEERFEEERIETAELSQVQQ
jgi:hypothetical protein